MRIVHPIGLLILAALVPISSTASQSPPANASQTHCAFPRTEDLMVSRASRQPEGSAQSGSPWIPLEALLLKTTAQRRDFMLTSIRKQLEGRHSTFDLPELDRVLAVMREIDREKFVPPAQAAAAYLPMSVEIGYCQTLSDAYVIALMTSAVNVQPNANVLDVGTGSGYQAAILSRLAAHVQSLEIVPQLALQARKRLSDMGYRNVDVATADGYLGWPARAPFDVIIVTAGSTEIPRPLLNQLKLGGRLIMPVGRTTLDEELVLAVKSERGVVTRCTLGLAAFVPMTGQAQSNPPRSSSSNASNPPRALPRCYAAPVT